MKTANGPPTTGTAFGGRGGAGAATITGSAGASGAGGAGATVFCKNNQCYVVIFFNKVLGVLTDGLSRKGHDIAVFHAHMPSLAARDTGIARNCITKPN